VATTKRFIAKKGFTMDRVHEWAVVGAGPCGVVAVACLVDHLQRTKANTTGVVQTIVWLDPIFTGGDLPRYREAPVRSSLVGCSSAKIYIAMF
jgi:hypothetical protein